MMRKIKLFPVLLALALPVQAQQFGAAVAIDEGEILIAEPTIRRSPAVIHRYAPDGNAWEEIDVMVAPPHDSGGDYFGRFIELDERSLVIGGTLFENSRGAVWTYHRDGDEWVFDQMLQPEDIQEEEAFGRFGALHEDYLFVSSLGFGGVGGVWVYERDSSGRWVEGALLQPDSGTPQEFFGWGLSYDGERLLVGSFGGETGLGAAYIFTRDAQGEWFQEARLALAEGVAQPNDIGFPGSPSAGSIGVGWFGGMALLGLPGRDRAAGAVFSFARDEDTGEWTPGPTIEAREPRPFAFFGHDIHDRDGQLWVSAPGSSTGGAIHRFAYEPESGTFEPIAMIEGTIDVDSGDGFGATVTVAGELAVVGQPGDDGGLGSAMVMRLDGDSWVSEAKLFIPGEPGLPAITGREVACGDDGMADQFDCSRIDILSFLPVGQIGGGRGIQANDVWGWTDPEDGREYAIVGRTDGTAFVDVTDPINPRYLGNLPKTPGSQTNVWRDMKVFADHVFIVADGAGAHGMQVFDLRRLRDVGDQPERFESDALYDGFASAHNIAINEDTGVAYALGANSGGDTCGGGLHMIDINEPTAPVFVGCFQDGITGRAGTGYSHDAMCVLYRGPDEEHVGREICFGSNETALSIADVTEKDDPVHLSSATYPNTAYAHQGWLTEDHRYFFMNDELDESAARSGSVQLPGTRTLIWDVSDLDDPVLAKEHFGEVLSTDHNLYIRGNLMYQSNYVSGLRILNIADPLNPVEVGFLDTVPWNDSVALDGSWSNYPFFESGTIVVTSKQEGVFLLRYRPRELLP